MTVLEAVAPGLAAVAFGAALPGLFFFNRRLLTRRRQRLVGRASGTIVGFEERPFTTRSGTTYHDYPLVGWTGPDGVRRTFEHDDSDDAFTLGATVAVMYDPANLDDALILSSASDPESRLAAVIFSLVGAVFVVVGVGIAVSRLT
jgi:hypothetical protein